MKQHLLRSIPVASNQPMSASSVQVPHHASPRVKGRTISNHFQDSVPHTPSQAPLQVLDMTDQRRNYCYADPAGAPLRRPLRPPIRGAGNPQAKGNRTAIYADSVGLDAFTGGRESLLWLLDSGRDSAAPRTLER
jgi:hypothetical protein